MALLNADVEECCALLEAVMRCSDSEAGEAYDFIWIRSFTAISKSAMKKSQRSSQQHPHATMQRCNDANLTPREALALGLSWMALLPALALTCPALLAASIRSTDSARDDTCTFMQIPFRCSS